jgi:hypothetical protein
LRSRGHSKASADLRNAIAETDSEVVKAGDKLDELKAIVSYLSGKQEAFKEGFQSVKKLIGIDQLPTRYTGNNEMPQPFSQVPNQTPVIKKQEDSEFDLPEGFRS